jgi:hypothetical protein
MKLLFRLLFLCILIVGADVSLYAQKGLVSGDYGVLRTRGSVFGPDTVVISYDSATIYHDKYYAIYRSDEQMMYIVSNTRQVILKQPGLGSDFLFVDFNDDGMKDIVVNYKSDVPDAKALLLFDYKQETFRLVEDFDQYPEPVPIQGTPFYYSYSRTGCADFDWRSELFYIKDYKAYKSGYIVVNQCPNSQDANGVYISRLIHGEAQLLEKLPVSEFNKYPEGKWDFLSQYWTKNNKKFKK